MTGEELKNAYQSFFIKSKAGEHFMNELINLIARNHEDAEKNPELARDYVQRAKGNREIRDHINSVMADRRKKK